jgi:hypothetical protein
VVKANIPKLEISNKRSIRKKEVAKNSKSSSESVKVKRRAKP